MKLGYLLINLATVGGGILVYDLVRKDPPASGSPVDVAPLAPREEPAAEPPPSEGPRLAGAQTEELLRRIEGLERRVRDAESMPRSVAVVDDAGNRIPGVTPTAPVETDGGSDDTDERGEPRSAFDPRQVQDFRALLEEVEKQRQEERRVEQIKNQFTRMDVQLTDDQQKSVIAETLRYRERVADAFRQATQDKSTREQRTAVMESLRMDYEVTVRRLVPEAEAQKILEGMTDRPGVRRGGGGGDRRRDEQPAGDASAPR
jgi:hypothetical protein